uniref:Protein kinase domain-containing protein n=1 Tax=Rhabditophanes sp. KR3021 TaxID=114890 RepID=A0AC35TZ26_9BILA
MLILADNENLLERLMLSLSLEDELGNERQLKSENTYNALLLDHQKVPFNLPSEGNGYLIVVGRDLTKNITDVIAECIHQVIVQNGNTRIFIGKTDVNEEDNVILQALLNSTKESWHKLWSQQLEKAVKLPESISRNERKGKVEKWLHNMPPVEMTLACLDDPKLHDKLCTFFNVKPIGSIKQIIDSMARDDTLNGLPIKPPALNWTPYPRCAEIQLSLKYSIPKGCLTEEMFRKMVSVAIQASKSEYEYEWVNGLLVREDVVKCTIVRNTSEDKKYNFIEISGRVDKEELDDDYPVPMKMVWSHLAKIIKAVHQFFDNEDKIPYISNLVLIGDIFFNNSGIEDRVEARSLDLMQCLSSIERLGKIVFKVNDRICSVNLNQVFPDIHPICDADLWKTRLITFNTDTEKKDPRIRCHSTSTAPLLSELHGSILHNDQSNLLGVAHRNRGRKVSFGGISAIPIHMFKTNDIPESSATEKPCQEEPTVFGSMAWLEFGNLEYDSWSFFLAPIHAILNGLYYLYAQSVFNEALKKEKNMCFDRFCLINTFLTSTLLLFPAIVSVASSQISYDASWESIDYTLVGLSFIYMIGMKYSDFTLSFRVDLRHFSILEHSKYFLASMGQWYLQNMAHATVYAFVSKILFVLSVIRFYLTIDLNENLEPSICKAVKYSDIKDKEICE